MGERLSRAVVALSLVIMSVAALLIAAGQRYEVVSPESNFGYRINTWTGEVVSLQLGEGREVVIPDPSP